MKNMFSFDENLLKLCAKGAIQNLLNLLHFSPVDMKLFWELATSDLFTLMKSLNESLVPRDFFIIKLRKQFDSEVPVDSTSEVQVSDHTKNNYKHIQCLKQSLKAFFEIKLPMLISVESKFAIYHHVVVNLRQIVVDYESMYTYPLTEDTLRQICGVNTTFQQISCGYGILPPTICKIFEANQYIQDWGTEEYFKQGSSIR
jgi:hypothetical protein